MDYFNQYIYLKIIINHIFQQTLSLECAGMTVGVEEVMGAK